MTTLYDLLGALPDDDADGLRAAFRKAAKANHPDVNPGNPEAAERFRRVVRANAILSDEQQRTAYDQLLEVARRQQGQGPKRSKASGTIRALAADVVKDAKYYRERGILAYRSGDLYIALANFDLAIDMDPGLSDSYINRGIVFHRLGDLKRAFSDVAEAKRIDDLNRKKSASGTRAP